MCPRACCFVLFFFFFQAVLVDMVTLASTVDGSVIDTALAYVFALPRGQSVSFPPIDGLGLCSSPMAPHRDAHCARAGVCFMGLTRRSSGLTVMAIFAS